MAQANDDNTSAADNVTRFPGAGPEPSPRSRTESAPSASRPKDSRAAARQAKKRSKIKADREATKDAPAARQASARGVVTEELVCTYPASAVQPVTPPASFQPQRKQSVTPSAPLASDELHVSAQRPGRGIRLAGRLRRSSRHRHVLIISPFH
jgi:hypothetical protein